MAAQTTFSMIAREMRKYYVTLLVIDQRPSQIYDEVMSQLGTRRFGLGWATRTISWRCSPGWLGKEALRWDAGQAQVEDVGSAACSGWGVPMPLPVRSRRYDDKFWEEPPARWWANE